MVSISNGILSVEISEKGAELMSVKDQAGTEYLWQGSAEFWAGRAYNLFPIIGRLTQNKYTYKGKEYEMNLHGFLRKTVVPVLKKTDDSVTFILKDNEETLKMYPFSFEFKLTYKLVENTLKTIYDVTNTGGETLVFAVGGHPGFNVPFNKGESFEDYVLEFGEIEPVKEIILSETCFITKNDRPFLLKDGKTLPLKHSLFDNDAIVLKQMAKSIALKSLKSGKSVTLDYPNMKYLGIWHTPKTEAPFVCIEPWSSIPSYDQIIDDFDTKEDMTHLESGKSYTNGFDITIK